MQKLSYQELTDVALLDRWQRRVTWLADAALNGDFPQSTLDFKSAVIDALEDEIRDRGLYVAALERAALVDARS